MAEVKWIKLRVGMFDGMSFKKIKKEELRDKLTAVWFELMDFAGRCNHDGAFMSVREVYKVSDIAIMLDRSEEEVRMCIEYFIKEEMVSLEDDMYMLSNWGDYQNTEGLEKIKQQNRERQKKFRDKQRKKFIKNENICVYCGKYGDTVDHVIPKSKGGLDVKENVVCCCSNCNSQKTNLDVVNFLNNKLRMQEYIDIERIINNEVLKKHVMYNFETKEFIALPVTLRNAAEEDTEEEKEGENKSKRENSRTLFLRLLPEYNLSDKVIEKMSEWITYKMERRESYKEQGMKTLLRRIENSYLDYGEDAICDIIDSSMASGYVGILFDKLKQNNYTSRNEMIKNRVSNVDDW